MMASPVQAASPAPDADGTVVMQAPVPPSSAEGTVVMQSPVGPAGKGPS